MKFELLKNVREDLAKGDEAQGLLECFCRSSVQNQLFNSLCRDWTFEKFVTNILPLLIVASIILTNYALQFVFRGLSNFERYRNLSTESTSRVIKIFVAQVLNTGVLILIVNAKFTRNPVVSFLNGSYDDLIPEWYLNVGTTLLITMIINIINLPIINTILCFLKVCLRCWDRKCTCNPKQTRKETHEEWEQLYMGPEFMIDLRYAQILTIIAICLLYSAGLPLLYLSTFLNLCALYWMDKLFLLKVCRLPRMFDEKLENVVRRTLYFFVFVHIFLAIWTYGNPEIFGDGESYSKEIEFSLQSQGLKITYVLETFWHRANQSQNIVLSVLFCILTAIVFLRLFFRTLLKKLFQPCLGRFFNTVRRENLYQSQRNYYECIHLEDLQLEKKYLEKEKNLISDKELKALLEVKLAMINQELTRRDPMEENHLKRFIGIFSYSVKHNPLYKKFFELKKSQVSEARPINSLKIK